MAYKNKADERANQRVHDRNRQVKKRLLGLCISGGCKAVIAADHNYCSEHLNYARDRSKTTRAAKRLIGACLWNGCNESAAVSRSYCSDHLIYTSSQRKAKREKNTKLGLCTACSSPIEVGSTNRKCRACVESYLVQRRTPGRRYAANRWEAKKRGKSWTLSKEDYCRLAVAPCNYCGLPSKVAYGVGLDRLDNSKGYEIENVVSCCDICNSVRNNIFSPSEMKELGVVVGRILTRRGTNGYRHWSKSNGVE